MLEQYLSQIQTGNLSDIQNQWEAESHRKSAVAVIFVTELHKEPTILLTRRSIHVNSHKRQIGFAGGRYEQGDQSPLETAIREAEEELGVPRERFQFHGYHRVVHDLNENSIFPVLLSVHMNALHLKINPQEVDEVLYIPVNDFFPHNAKRFKFNYFGVWRESIVFKTSSHPVWGLTAQMLLNLKLNPKI